MKTPQRILSSVLVSVATAVIGIPVLRYPSEWPAKLCELDTFFVAFTLICTALLLWPHSEPATAQH